VSVNADSLRIILGMKLRSLRQEKRLPLRDVAARAGVSVSYLSEIEAGKKYPKPEKLLDLADALGVSFDALVSQQVEPALDPIKSALSSPFAQEFPFRLFGIEPSVLLGLMSDAPEKAGALLRALVEVARTYDVRVEHFLFAALRSYQQLHGNYFPDLEEAAAAYRSACGLTNVDRIDSGLLRHVLENDFGYEIDEHALPSHPDLSEFRSVFVPGRRPRLHVNGRLLPEQKAFIFAREIGYEVLGLGERVLTSSWLKVESFEQVLNNFRASYFGGALLMDRGAVLSELADRFAEPRWHPAGLLASMRRFGVTPEMYFYRLTELIPQVFGLSQLYFMRFHHEVRSDSFWLTKVLNMSQVPVPHGIRPDEHYCRRWPGLRLLAGMDAAPTAEAPLVAAQRSHFLNDDADFFVVTVARPLALSAGTNTAVSLGFLMDDAFRQTVRFAGDPDVPRIVVNLTCERCPLTPDECTVRAAPPVILRREHTLARREAALAELLLASERG
jgi:XRE family transcriptional regulator, fatty acid utilization regulator